MHYIDGFGHFVAISHNVAGFGHCVSFLSFLFLDLFMLLFCPIFCGIWPLCGFLSTLLLDLLDLKVVLQYLFCPFCCMIWSLWCLI